MKPALIRCLFLALPGASLALPASEQPQLQAFPGAKPGAQRFVSALPHKYRSQKQHFRLQRLAGKTMLSDGVNRLRLGSRIKALPLQGWGYTYYEVVPETAVISTRMAIPPGVPEVRQLVTTTPLLIAYNNRLPLVAYGPEDYEPGYRIWTAAETFQSTDRD